MKTLDAIETWLRNVACSHSDSEGTAREYREILTAFCKFIEATPQEIMDEYEKSDERAFKRKFAEYLRAWIAELSKTKAPNTVRLAASTVKSFFKYNDLPLSFVPHPRARVKFHNRDITKDEIKAVLDVSSPRDRAFFAMMVQGGLRPSTLCKLKLKSLEPDFSNGTIPCKISVSEEDAKGQTHSFFTFIGSDAIELLKAYLSTRSNTQPNDYVFTALGKDAPANEKALSNEFRISIRKLHDKGLVKYEVREEKKPNELRLYCLRKYFSFNASAMGTENKEFLMGHSQGVRDHYLAQDPEHFRTLYLEKALPNLRLTSATALEYEKVMSEKDERIAVLEEKVAKLTETMQRLIERVKSQEKLNTE
jgi:integrase